LQVVARCTEAALPTAPENNKESARCTTGVKSMEEVEIVREEESVGGRRKIIRRETKGR
jgi:hypothetical protein